jgi:mono/diheme cytochrome c family protein
MVERSDPSASEPLRRLVRTAGDPGRLHAFWALAGTDQLDDATALAALRDSVVPLQVAAMRAVEPRLPAGDTRIVEHVLALAESESPVVRRQAALTIALLPDEISLPVLVRSAIRDGRITGMAEAIVSGLADREIDFLGRLQAHGSIGSAGDTAALAVATVVARGEPDGINRLRLLSENTEPDDAIATAIIQGFERNTFGNKDTRTRLKLPVEPEALAILAVRSTGALAKRALATLALIDGPAAQAARAPVAALTATEQQRFIQGQALYALCGACHQANGRGLEGLAPSLVGSTWATGDPEVAAAIVLKGKTDGILAMPPLAALDDASIAAALTYVRRSWGNEASAVTPEQVASARQRHVDRNESWTEETLKEFTATQAN